MKSPFFVYFEYFLGTFPIRPVSMIPWLLNWIIFELNQQNFFNWIISWIESWVQQYWIKYWMNHCMAKFKHWIESDWISATTTLLSTREFEPRYLIHARFTNMPYGRWQKLFQKLSQKPCTWAPIIAIIIGRRLDCWHLQARQWACQGAFHQPFNLPIREFFVIQTSKSQNNCFPVLSLDSS